MDPPSETPTRPPTLGLVLAGGQGRRLGGIDKPLLDIGGRTILARTVAVLRPDCAALAISLNGDPHRFASTGLPMLPDEDGGRSGPLAGLLAGLDHAAASRPALDWVVSVAGDAPFLPRDLVSRLHAERGAATAIVAASGGRRHPVIGLWSVTLRGLLRQVLAEGERRVGRWADAVDAATAEWPMEPIDPFLNVNEPGDLATARALAERWVT